MPVTTSIALPKDLEACHALIETQAETIQQLSSRVDYLARRLFGPRTERMDPDQLVLFEEMLQEAAQECPPVEDEASVPAYGFLVGLVDPEFRDPAHGDSGILTMRCGKLCDSREHSREHEPVHRSEYLPV